MLEDRAQPLKRFFENQTLAPFTTLRIGGPAKYLVRVFDADGVRRALQLHSRCLIIGRGSKLLVGDCGFDGVAIVMCIDTLKFFDGRAYAGAGVFLPALSKEYEKRCLSGLEWVCGIPGSVGGAVMMNAGAFGADMSGIIEYVEVLRGDKIIRIDNADCNFGYRHSGLGGDIILGAMLKAQSGDAQGIKQKRAECAAKRMQAQPSGHSFGSVFKAADVPAWKYIDGCGLRGERCGGAQISPKHANFIINDGSATASDVIALINAAKAETYSRYNVKLQEEVIIV